MSNDQEASPFDEDPFAQALEAEIPDELAPTKKIRATTVSDGRRTEIPNQTPLPEWPDAEGQDMGDGVDGDNPLGSIDYKDLETLNYDLQKLRVRQNRVRRAMRESARDAVNAKGIYNRAFRRALIQQTGGSADQRKATAELLCEELEADMAMKNQIAGEYETLFRSVRDDTENAKVVSYNLRALL